MQIVTTNGTQLKLRAQGNVWNQKMQWTLISAFLKERVLLTGILTGLRHLATRAWRRAPTCIHEWETVVCCTPVASDLFSWLSLENFIMGFSGWTEFFLSFHHSISLLDANASNCETPNLLHRIRADATEPQDFGRVSHWWSPPRRWTSFELIIRHVVYFKQVF